MLSKKLFLEILASSVYSLQYKNSLSLKINESFSIYLNITSHPLMALKAIPSVSGHGVSYLPPSKDKPTKSASKV